MISKKELINLFDMARDLQQPVYSQPLSTKGSSPMLLLEVPVSQKGRFGGVLLAEFSIDNLLRYATPTEVLARYAVTLKDGNGTTIAGTPLAPRAAAQRLLPWRAVPNEYEIPIAPVGNSLKLRAQAYHTSLGLVSNGLFWLVLFFCPVGWVWQALAFLLFRFFDITKPQPARFFDEKVKNGFGVMADDLVAGVYTVVTLVLMQQIWSRFAA